MKIAIVLFVTLAIGCVLGGDEYGYRGNHYQPGFRRVHEGVAAVYRNDVRQEQVNHIAEHYGAGTGTARFVGVPGTNGYYGYRHHEGYGYPHGHGYERAYNDGYYGDRYNDRHGDRYGDRHVQGYGHDGYAARAYY